MSTLSDQDLALLGTLEKRFNKNIHRHPKLGWDKILQILTDSPKFMETLHAMEETGGEPDVVQFDAPLASGIYYVDFAKESPKGRRSCCFDQSSREGRKDYPPQTSAHELANDMGIEILDEAEYKFMQSLEAFDLKTSTWIITPDAIRNLGGALFADRRYDHVFVYHNGASSYYAARAFRGKFKIAAN